MCTGPGFSSFYADGWWLGGEPSVSELLIVVRIGCTPHGRVIMVFFFSFCARSMTFLVFFVCGCVSGFRMTRVKIRFLNLGEAFRFFKGF